MLSINPTRFLQINALLDPSTLVSKGSCRNEDREYPLKRKFGLKTERKPIAILLCDPARESVPLRKLAGVLPRLAEFRSVDISTLQSLTEFLASGNVAIEEAAIYVEANWFVERGVESDASLDKANIIAVDCEPGEPIFSKISSQWKQKISYLALGAISNKDLPKVLSVSLEPCAVPGISAIAEKNSEILFEKVQRLSQIGHRIDQVVQNIETKFPEMASQSFNLRNVSYSILQLALMEAMAATKIMAVVDFQITASNERIAFSTRFSARPETYAAWRSDMANLAKPLWRSLTSSTDLLVFTHLEERNEIEVKALVSQEAEGNIFHTRSILFNSIREFLPEAAGEGAKQIGTFKAFETKLPDAKMSSESGQENEAEANSSEVRIGSVDEGLKLKIKADMLEDEKNTLQELVKKKTSLVSGLHKDINKLQKDAATAHNNAQKEALKLRMENEQAKNDVVKLNKELARMKRRFAELEEKQKAANTDSSGVKRDFEKELKASELAKKALDTKIDELIKKRELQEGLLEETRKQHRESQAEAKDLKAKLVISQKALEAAQMGGSKSSGNSEADQRRDGGAGDKLKEAQKQSLNAKQAAENFEKESKRLEIKLANTESALKATQAKLDKQVASAEKVLEEVKKQKTDALKKVDDLSAIIKTKLEEANARERELKRKIDELTAQTGGAKKEKDKAA